MSPRRRHCRQSGSAARRLWLILALAGSVTAGCATKPFLSSGDANSAAVGFAGGDVAAATAIAEDHCARYERVAHLVETQEDVAYFECRHR